MTGEVCLTSEVPLWGFGLDGNRDALGWKCAGPGTMRAAGRCPAGNCQCGRRWGSSWRRVGKVGLHQMLLSLRMKQWATSLRTRQARLHGLINR